MNGPRLGFALVEMLIALVVAGLLAAGSLSVLRSQRRIAQRQAQSADLQQSIRVLGVELARVARMAGRGGLPGRLSIEVRNNVPEGTRIGGPGTPQVAAGSDVLIVRGALSSSVFAPAVFANGGGGVVQLVVGSQSPLGRAQRLEELSELVAQSAGEALVLSAGPEGGAAIAELLGGSVEPGPGGGNPVSVTLSLRTGGSPLADSYRQLLEREGLELGGEFAPERATRVALLDEVRYYVRVSPDPFSGEPRARVARARFYPGTEIAHPSSPAAGEDLVDHALDLQVALGFDLDRDGEVAEGGAAGSGADEWLGNEPGDDPEDPVWEQRGPSLIRISGWLRSARPLVGYVAPARSRLEDRLYAEAERPAPGLSAERRFLRAEFRHVVQRRSAP